MVMERPVKIKWRNEKQACEFLFDRHCLPDYLAFQERGILHHVMGSVVWPEGMVDGYALLGAQNIEDGLIWIYEEQRFRFVSPVLGDIGSSLSEFLEVCWSGYFGRTFFYQTSFRERDQDLTFKRYFLQVIHEAMINPKPVFVPCMYALDEEMADNLLLEYQIGKRFRFEKGGGLHGELKDVSGKDAKEFPAVRALRVLVSGFERTPWKEPVL
jgi:hypothetical protein